MKRIEWCRLVVRYADGSERYVGPTMKRETAQSRHDKLIAKGFGARIEFLFATVDGKRI